MIRFTKCFSSMATFVRAFVALFAGSVQASPFTVISASGSQSSYSSFSAACEAAADGCTIRLNEDYNYGSYYNMPRKSGTIVFDLNGRTFASNIDSQFSTLIIRDSVGGGQLRSGGDAGDALVYASSGTIVIEHGYIGQGSGRSLGGSSVVVKGGYVERISGSGFSLYGGYFKTDPSSYLGSGATVERCNVSAYGTIWSYRVTSPQSTMQPVPALASGLVAWYKFDGNANDSSGNGNHGTVNGATLTTDRFGNPNSAYSFDGNDWISTANSTSLAGIYNTITVSAWIRPNVSGSSCILCKGTTSSLRQYGLVVNTTATTGNYCINDGNYYGSYGDIYVNSSTPPSVGVWQHVTMTYDGSVVKAYLNGTLVGTRSVSGYFPEVSGGLLLGKDPPGSLEYYSGAMDDVRIYNRALSAVEVAALYGGVVPPTPSPLAAALNTTSVVTTGGNSNWFAQTSETHDGVSAAKSGSIGNSQQTWMETTVVGPAEVSFWWKVSSESYCDWLRFAVDGNEQLRISGTSGGWEKRTTTLGSGSHTLRWSYTKDGSVSSGSDCGWVDQLTVVRPHVAVTFDANGGECDAEPRELEPGAAVGALPTCSWVGHRFLGWFTDPAGGTVVSAETVVNSDVTFYAHWSNFLTEEVAGKTWYYSIDANGGAVVEPGAYSGALTVPDRLGGHAVLYIGAGAFAGCTELTALKLPDGLKSIRERAFDGCSKLGYVKIPSNVTWIGAYAFRDCTAMTSAYVPAKVATLGVGAYMGCTSLASITLAGPLTTIASDSFNGCRSLANVTLPKTVTTINARAFKGCRAFTAVTLPDAVTTLHATAFEGCTGVTSITYRGELGTLTALFPDCISHLTLVKVSPGTRSLKAGAFDGCASLTGVKLQEGLTTIGANAFRGCTGLVRVTIPSTVTTIGDGAFEGCTRLDGEVLPATVKSLGKGVFRDCTGMKTVTIASGRTSIPEATFAGCTHLTKAVLPDTVTSIGVSAFDGCASLTYEKIPANVTWIGSNAFRNCTAMTSAYVPAKVTTIGVGAYMGCTSLASITLAGPLTAIASDCFNGCRSLANVTLPATVTAVNARAFKGCLAFTAVSLPDCLKSIASEAFADITSLNHVELPISLTTIETGAFKGCWSVRSVTFPASRATLSEVFPDSFRSINRVIVPTGVAALRTSAFAGCSSLTEVSLPSTVTSIGARAFEGCSSLEAVILPSHVTWLGKYVFNNCSRLRQVAYPTGLGGVPEGTFCGCSSYVAFDFGTCPSSIGARAFAGCPYEELKIPEGVANLGDHAFAGCSSLRKVSLPCGLGNLGEGVFSDCYNIISVTTSPAYGVMRTQFPSSYSRISDITLLADDEVPTSSFFSGCTGITTLFLCNVADSLASLLGEACASLRAVEIAEGLTILPDDFFIGCPRLDNLVLPSTLESLGSYDPEGPGFVEMLSNRPNGPWYAGSWLLAYKGRKPETFTVRDGTVGIGAYAFSEKDEEESTYLSEINLPASLKYIGDGAFYQCTSLDNVIIPDLVEIIGIGAFQSCTYMQNLKLGAGLQHIGDLAFADTVLLHAEMKSGLKTIGRQAFANCNSLLSVEMPSSLEEFGYGVFSGCPRIEGAVIPTHLMTISQIFPNYGGLKYITIAEGETVICDRMFAGASKMVSIAIPGTIAEVGTRAFEGCASLQSVSLPDSVERLGEAAFSGCSSMKQIRLPGRITALPDALFENCSDLRSFIVPASVTDLGDDLVRGWNSGVTEIYFLGNAPVTHGGVYSGSNGSLTSYVVDMSKGWDGIRTSTRLPELWNGRAITRWTANQFDVTYNANGGLFPDKATKYACEQITDNAYSLPPNNPTWAGHTFAGWFTTESAGAGTRVTADTIVTATRPHELFAHWTVGNTITVTFNATGGTNPSGWDTHTYTADSTYGKLPTPTREGYTFDGWYTAKSGGTRMVPSSATPSINAELYAHWTIGSYHIRFNANGGVGSSYSQAGTWGEGMTLVPNRFTRNGYVFAGWATMKTDIARFAECAYVDDYSTMVNETVDLYAVWARATYSVRFDSNGGTGTMPSQSFVYGDAQYLTANAFTRSGYVFEGWSRTTTGGVVYRDREMVSRLTDEGGTVTLFAVWGRTSYYSCTASAPTRGDVRTSSDTAYRSGKLSSGDGVYELILDRELATGFIRIVYEDGETVTAEVEVVEMDCVLLVLFEDGSQCVLLSNDFQSDSLYNERTECIRVDL